MIIIFGRLLSSHFLLSSPLNLGLWQPQHFGPLCMVGLVVYFMSGLSGQFSQVMMVLTLLLRKMIPRHVIHYMARWKMRIFWRINIVQIMQIIFHAQILPASEWDAIKSIFMKHWFFQRARRPLHWFLHWFWCNVGFDRIDSCSWFSKTLLI